MSGNNDLRNMITALFLSSIVLIGWQYFYMSPQEEAAKARQQLIAKETAQTEKLAIETAATNGVKNSIVSRDESVSSSKRIKISSDKLRGSISLIGAQIDDLTLIGYYEELSKESPEVVLLSPANTDMAYFAEQGWISADKTLSLPSSKTEWTASGNVLSPSNPISFKWENDQGLTFERVISLDEDYMFTITQKITNLSGKPIKIAPYGFANRNYTQESTAMLILHEGLIGTPDGTLHEFSYGDLKDDSPHKYSFDGATGWLGVSDKYWLTAFAPKGESFKANFQYYKKDDSDHYQVDYLGNSRVISNGEATQFTVNMFSGAKKLSLLDSYSKQHNIPLFDKGVDFGVLYFLTKPLFLVLDFFNGIIGNFGIAILLLTVIIKLFLFPLANKSYKSMAQMRELMPQITEIRERFKDDRVEMNKEVMELYKRKKVNPAGGCLPLLVQMPIFFALYKVLFVTIEMRHAPFYGWIHDLSAPDPTNIFTLFGLIPWDAPSLMHVGILPLAMAFSMTIQNKLNPKPNDATQAMVIKWMPWVFLFVFAGFPAGLVIYWVWSNILSIIQQWVIIQKNTTK